MYIHSQGMVHGDLKGVRSDRLNRPPTLPSLHVKANILIDQAGHARLVDFGLLTVLSDPANLLSSSSYTQGGTARWMSPELIAPQRFGFESSRPTKSSDCYALGMVIYETISGHPPFHKYTDLTVFLKVVEGERPFREARFMDSLWEMLELCWEPQPEARPSIEDVLHRLESSSQPGESPASGLDGELDEGDGWYSGSDSSGTFSSSLNIPWSQFILFARAMFVPIQYQHITNPCTSTTGWASYLPSRLSKHTHTQHRCKIGTSLTWPCLGHGI